MEKFKVGQRVTVKDFNGLDPNDVLPPYEVSRRCDKYIYLSAPGEEEMKLVIHKAWRYEWLHIGPAWMLFPS